MILLNKLAEDIHKLAKKQGFWYDGIRGLPRRFCAMHDEISAMHRAHMKYGLRSDAFNKAVTHEALDEIIYCLDLLEWLGVDIEKELKEVHEDNKAREYMHGNKF